ncbi:TIGR03086 family protein [Pseudonocardiaceae bacterium YIM PH 21723]|nr:TIGR03086 family protein [Pseudonocardiaceae bacterium YIM PH 21723]
MNPVAPAGSVGLLERAVGYTLGSLHLVTDAAMTRPTPCARWDLRGLLTHMNDGLAALQEAAEFGHVQLDVRLDPVADPVAALRDRACRLLGAWLGSPRPEVVVGCCPLATVMVASAGALEVAVHGWDIAAALGRTRPLPDALGRALLDVAPLLVSAQDRPARFAAPIPLPSGSPGEHLLAFLGREPLRS